MRRICTEIEPNPAFAPSTTPRNFLARHPLADDESD
jgi:hypothetical protein